MMASIAEPVPKNKSVSGAFTPRRIDPHVHCRDWDESEKATIKQVMELARSQGIVAIFDMPNTKPPITTKELVERRLKTAKEEGCLEGYYLYMGATNNPEQLRKAVEVIDHNPKVVGLKLYAGKSVGDLSVTKLEDQRLVFKTLAEVGYTGPIVTHCERLDLEHPEKWDPERPHTWNEAKPPEAEIGAVIDVIGFSMEFGFKGHLHICHTSTPSAVNVVNAARRSMNISCAATPHHLLCSTEERMGTKEGVAYKVNPPIREERMRLELLKMLRSGKIDWIETDHAPHKPEEKTYAERTPKEAYMSGIRSLERYDELLQDLLSQGMPETKIRDITYHNIKRVFTKVVE